MLDVARALQRADRERRARKQAEALLEQKSREVYLANQALRDSREWLELRVAERTAELAAANEDLARASRAKSEFLANMSHEIRTPLTAILGFADVLRRGIASPQQCGEYLETIHSSGQHLLTLLNDILDLSKFEAGRMECERVRCSPHAVLSDVLSILRVRAQEKGLRLDCEWTTPAPETIVTDPARLRQLLMNLVSNAVKFTHRGSVSIRAAVDPAGAEPRMLFEVADTGVGIHPENLDRIFQPFDQADNSVTRQYGGTGLGLTISRHIARQLGGEITVESQPGRGSTFRVAIESGPLEGVALVHERHIEAVRPRPTRGLVAAERQLPPIRILLVDDGETNRQLLSLVLTNAGASVATAENGEQGVGLVRRERFDLVLMDMQMPVMDGYTAAHTLRAEGCTLPILALTAHAMRGDEEKCLAAGCSGYLTKPVQIDEMLNTIRAAVLPLTCPEGAPEMSTTPPTSPDRRPPTNVPAIRSSLPTELPEFQRIVEQFLSRLGEKMRQIESHCAAGDWKSLAGLAHWLKGTGGTVGFPCLSTTAAELEDSAHRGDGPTAHRVLSDLKSLVDRLSFAAV